MIRLQNVLKMSSRRICERFWRRFEDVLKTSWQDVLKMSWRRFCKKSWRRLENVLKTSWQDVLKTSWRRIAKTNILVLTKTSWRRLLKTKTKDVFKTSSSRQMFAGKAQGAKKEYVLKHIKGNITTKEIMRS